MKSPNSIDLIFEENSGDRIDVPASLTPAREVRSKSFIPRALDFVGDVFIDGLLGNTVESWLNLAGDVLNVFNISGLDFLDNFNFGDFWDDLWSGELWNDVSGNDANDWIDIADDFLSDLNFDSFLSDNLDNWIDIAGDIADSLNFNEFLNSNLDEWFDRVDTLEEEELDDVLSNSLDDWFDAVSTEIDDFDREAFLDALGLKNSEELGSQLSQLFPLTDKLSDSTQSLAEILTDTPYDFGQMTTDDDIFTYALLPESERDRLSISSGIDAIVLLGGNDVATDNNDSRIYFGNTGEDIISGWGGSDTLTGGKDEDVLEGGDDDDWLFGNRQSDIIDGGAGNDTLLGGQDADVLNGGDGDDVLSGDRGVDVLCGEAGADEFILQPDPETLSTDPSRADVVCDFSVSEGDRMTVLGVGAIEDLAFEDVFVTQSSGENVGTAALDTVIRQVSTGEVLGVVVDRVSVEVQNALSLG